MALDQGYVVNAAELPTSAFATKPLSQLKCEVSSIMPKPYSWSLSFNGFVQLESFAVFVAVDCCFWWQKFTQQEAFTIPEHGRHCFFHR
jgi:hypothetical protein